MVTVSTLEVNRKIGRVMRVAVAVETVSFNKELNQYSLVVCHCFYPPLSLIDSHHCETHSKTSIKR